MLVVLIPISLADFLSQVIFAAWDAQSSVDSENIWDIYTYLLGASKEKSGGLLWQIALSEDGGNIAFVLCTETRASWISLHAV